MTPRGSYSSWLGDHQDEAAELAALLHEAAPKLALAGLRSAPTRASSAGSTRMPALPKARSYELTDSTRDRLRAAVPLPTGGCGQGGDVLLFWGGPEHVCAAWQP